MLLVISESAEATIHSFSDALIGMDSDNVEHIWNYLWRYNSAFRGNSIGGAISAIDMALWDIKGKGFKHQSGTSWVEK